MNNIPKIKLSLDNSLSKPIPLSGGIVNPKRDWNILIILFLVFIVSSMGFDYYMYQQIVSGDMYVSVARTEIVIENLKSDDLKKILDNFETKKSKITTLKLENLVDPSL
ncbi:MAG: hypothetical protein ABIF22_00485 [bacterium]